MLRTGLPDHKINYHIELFEKIDSCSAQKSHFFRIRNHNESGLLQASARHGEPLSGLNGRLWQVTEPREGARKRLQNPRIKTPLS